MYTSDQYIHPYSNASAHSIVMDILKTYHHIHTARAHARTYTHTAANTCTNHYIRHTRVRPYTVTQMFINTCGYSSNKCTTQTNTYMRVPMQMCTILSWTYQRIHTRTRLCSFTYTQRMYKGARAHNVRAHRYMRVIVLFMHVHILRISTLRTSINGLRSDAQ